MGLDHEKSKLRAIARKRRQIVLAEHAASSWQLPDAPSPLGFAPSMAVASYRPTRTEADPAPLEQLARAVGVPIAYPRIEPDGAMRFFVPRADAAFKRDPHGFDAPGPDSLPIAPRIILVPLLAFDRRGTRLGQGGGHYDRALAALANSRQPGEHDVTAVGIAWSVQEMSDLPRAAWDYPLDMIVTEREWIVISGTTTNVRPAPREGQS